MSSVRVDVGAAIGKIRPLHGVNNGPVGYGGLVDVSGYYRELGVPYVRLHDPNWPHPREVDIPQIFPNFDADPDDPASYDFDRTDRYIKRILDTGARVVYRLGTSIEHTEKTYYIDPPADFEKWARICVGIVKHYTQGWAGGMRDGVDYWEIWNEPDIPLGHMWTGTFEQYLELYRAASTAIKAFDPSVKVGGYAAGHPEKPNVDQFPEYCRSNSLPLDFFSWHTYGNQPENYVEHARIVREALDRHGFTGVPTHLNEWNYWPPAAPPVFGPGNEYVRREMFELQKNQVGASFVAATLIVLQDQPVDVANYYDGQPFALYCGLFDYYGVPQKAYKAMRAFSLMLRYPERVKVEVESPDGKTYALAAANRETGEAAVLISRFEGAEDECEVQVTNPPGGMRRCLVLLVDRDRDLEPVYDGAFDPATGVKVYLRKHAVALVRFL